MPVVAAWDAVGRRIYLAVADWQPIEIYREYRAKRRTDEAFRAFAPLLKFDGNIAKTADGSRRTPRYMTLLGGCKIIPLDGAVAPVTNITGQELITDDGSAPLVYDGISVRPLVNYEPPTAEVIMPSAAALVAALQGVTVAANLVAVHGQAIAGSGSASDPWGPA
jgi:hypothetical protein